jgi:hypothetical protein
MLGCPPKLLSEELKKYHRIGITLTSLGLVNYGIMAATATNTQGLAKRITSSTIFVPPVFKEAPSAVTEPFAAQTNVTLLSRWEINKPNQTLQNDGFTLALSPLAHMMVLSQPRRCEYLKRMVDSRGDATVLADPDTQREFVGVLNSCPASVAWEEVPLVHYWKAYQLHKR